MAIMKCKMCGGDLQIEEGMSVCECEYCGSKQTVPTIDNDKKITLYERANRLRYNCEFDKAETVYESIVGEFHEEAEAYWGLVLCKYGIEYVDDPVTGNKVPTCHRSSFDSVMDDSDFEMVMENADTISRQVYREQAKEIEEIRKGIIEVSGKETPYDIFICYKETAEDGQRTIDSVLAQDVYEALTGKGYRVFFSRITLEDKLGTEYEPYIFAALNSAKVMLAFGTSYDYYNAVWVKNEWSRFLKLMAADKSKHLIPCYKNIDAYDIPKEFTKLQAQDLGKVGAVQDLIRGISKIIGVDQLQTVKRETVVEYQGGGNNVALIKRGYMALEDGEWQKADDFFEEVLNQDAESAEAYLGKWLAKIEISSLDGLVKYYDIEEDETEVLEACPIAEEHIASIVKQYTIVDYLNAKEIRKLYDFDRSYISELSFRVEDKDYILEEINSEKLFIRTKQYATGGLADSLNKALDTITTKLERRIIDAKNNDNLSIANVIAAYNAHISQADANALEMYNKALEKQEFTYKSIVEQMNQAQTIVDYEKTRDLFRKMHGYKDSNSLANKCKEEIDRLYEEKSKEVERRESERRKEIKRRTKKNKIKIIIIVVVIVGCMLSYSMVTKNNDYNKAVDCMKAQDYIVAYELFDSLNGYKDSEELKKSIEFKIECIDLATANIGDTIFYGNYNEHTEWVVLAKEEGKILVISKYALARRPYNIMFTTVTWESCTLRTWLNESFITSAFSSEEEALILSSTIVNSDNVQLGSEEVNNTNDKVFLLSIDEVNEYFASLSDRETTLYDGTRAWWWLRSLGSSRMESSYVDSIGRVDALGYHVDDVDGAVRPAMWIDVSGF